jgi:oxygen-independent coproporphyrinogen-3 oxidase
MLQSAKEFLIEKYNVPAPRYTSYPTVPGWDKAVPDAGRWLGVVKRTFDESNDARGISLYIHLPFCESLCTYCGCNTRITRNHGVETGYVEAVLREWQIYLRTFGRKPVLRELHLGGGTPTFFSPANLRKLLEGIFADSILHPDREFSFEGHPNNTTAGHLQTLYELGFRRVSFGIQDCDEKVQRTINRVQPFENVRRVTEQARRIGYQSVNFDLIYGLPYQTLESVAATIDQVATLRPDRIAFYSYAHVPWIKPGQRSYTDKDLPADAYKRALYELGLENSGPWATPTSAWTTSPCPATPSTRRCNAKRCAATSWATPRATPTCSWAWACLRSATPSTRTSRTRKRWRTTPPAWTPVHWPC